ncbi:transcriptional regulator, SarA/Rot family [Mycolicibacter heraklionensis]|uniref:MarR family winged helix-turn-helix transcriptional regulator n=1 Tax=Mycolicibacter heraklionensis TaxID=512402 RepID=UPI0009ECED02|nr:MarR family transcriptional regulator [Mycolicibacter heraklionensis]
MTSVLSQFKRCPSPSSAAGTDSALESAEVSSPIRRGSSIPSPAVDDDGAENPAHHLPGLDELEQRCWQDFLDSSSLLLGLINRRLLARHDLSQFEYLVLEALDRSADGSARMGDLAHAMVLAPSRLTELMRRMESKGLVRRNRSRTDGRGVVASITREGRARIRPAARTYAQSVRALYLVQMSRPQMIALGDNCRRIGVPLKAAQKARRRSAG